MSLREVHGHPVGENAADLAGWLRSLDGCPPVTATATVECPAHDEPATWFYVEADAAEGVARVRCLACGGVRQLLDSAQRWTYPPAWACPNCSQSIAEVAVGVHPPDGADAGWLAVAVRCVDCGRIDGVTDAVVADVDPASAFAP